MIQISKHSHKWLLAILALAVLFFAACNNEDTGSIDPESRNIPDQEGWNSTVTLTKAGRPSVVVRYGHMRKFANKKQTQFDNGIVVNFFNSKGDTTSVLTADGGLMYDLRNDFEAVGNVFVVARDGKTLQTEKLHWNEAEQRIYSDEFVTITTAEGDTLMGEGFESDQAINKWRIIKPHGVTGKTYALDEIEKKEEKKQAKQDSTEEK